MVAIGRSTRPMARSEASPCRRELHRSNSATSRQPSRSESFSQRPGSSGSCVIGFVHWWLTRSRRRRTAGALSWRPCSNSEVCSVHVRSIASITPLGRFRAHTNISPMLRATSRCRTAAGSSRLARSRYARESRVGLPELAEQVVDGQHLALGLDHQSVRSRATPAALRIAAAGEQKRVLVGLQHRPATPHQGT